MLRSIDKLGHRLKDKLHSSSESPHHVPSTPSGAGLHCAPSQADIIAHRLHHGINLASIFVLERWIDASMFPGATPGSSELAAVSAYASEHGLAAAQSWREDHWERCIAAIDWGYLAQKAAVTTVRLPLGWWSLGPEFCRGTPFESVAAVYQNSWAAVLRVLEKAAAHRVGVVLDLHALPGGANAFEHSGTNSGKAEFLDSSAGQEVAIKALVQMVRSLGALSEWVAGVQLVNEATVGDGMLQWYDRALHALANAGCPVPVVYIGHLWEDRKYLDYAVRKNEASRKDPRVSPPVAVDVHRYYCHDGNPWQNKPVDDIVRQIETTELSDMQDFGQKEVSLIIGEYSCGLADGSRTSSGDAEQRFGRAQQHRWGDGFRALAGGSFFWAYKPGWNGGGWEFSMQLDARNLVIPSHLAFPRDRVRDIIAKAEAGLEAAREAAFAAHAGYWGDAPHYEHWRFKEGYGIGYGDALAFFRREYEQGRDGGDKIGLVNLWTGKRLREHVHTHGASKAVWEFEHGMRQGIMGMEKSIE